MIQIRMMKEDDMQAVYADVHLKPLLLAEAWGDMYCIIAEENGTIVGGLSGSVSGNLAALQVCAIGGVQAINGTVLTEGLIRSILYVLDKRGVSEAYLVTDVAETVRQKIGFAPIDAEALPEFIKRRDGAACSVDIKEFLAQDCCGCKK